MGIQTHNVYPLQHILEKRLFLFNFCRFSFPLLKAKKERLGNQQEHKTEKRNRSK